MPSKSLAALATLAACLVASALAANAGAQTPGAQRPDVAAPVDRTAGAPVDAAVAGATVEAAHAAYALQLAGRLADTGEARGLALAAWLRDAHRPGAATDATPVADAQARAWRALAFQRAGTDPVALALLSSAPPGDPVPAQALARWRQLEPANLVPVLLAETDAAALVAAAGSARTAHGHVIAQLRWIVDAVRRHPPETAALAALVPDGTGVDGLAVMTGWQYLALSAMPDYGVLVDACRTAAADVAATCRHAATVLQAGDTRLAEAVGLALARDLAPTHEARRAAEAARQRFDWQMFEIGHLSGRAPAQQLHEYVRLLADPALTTEAALNLAQLRQAGVPLDPPPGWRPPR